MDRDPATHLAEALAEAAELRDENARLRGLLGLENRRDDGHRHGWTPTLFTRPTESAPIDGTASIDERVTLVRTLFGARSDVFAIRWENASTAKSGWSPAIRGGWGNKRATKEYVPLTDEILARHLRGEVTIGVYPLLPSDSCTLLACDFDQGTWALDALAYLDACHRGAVPAALERSRSGNGAHVWVFFADAVPATTARSLGTSLLREAMAARAELDLSSYDRFYPSQDFMPKGSFGNLIALPLHGECLKRGTTAFLDPTTMHPWPDQWHFLSSVARLSSESAKSVAESMRPVDAGPGVTLADLAKSSGPRPPSTIRARLAAAISIERSGLPRLWSLR